MRRRFGWAVRGRLLSVATAMSVAAVMLTAPVAGAVSEPKGLWRPHKLPTTASVPVHTPTVSPAKAPARAKPYIPQKVTWPNAAAAQVSLAAGPAASAWIPATTRTAGPLASPQVAMAAKRPPAGIPVLVAEAGVLDKGLLPKSTASSHALAANRSAATPSAVRVAVASHAVAQKAGVDGLLVSLSRTDTSKSAERVSVALDYSQIRDAFGGDFAGSLELVSYPACVLTTPQAEGCDVATPVAASANQLSTGRLVADVTLPASAPTASSVDAAHATAASGTVKAAAATVQGMTVLAATSTPDASGTSGSYAASPLNDSAKWGESGNTGAFTYSYPITTPPTVGGTAPKLSLDYNSQAADGMTSQTNGQGSWAGDGWTTWPGQITRSYRSCSDDGQAAADSDECWAGDNASLTLNGASHTLVPVESTKQSDGTYTQWRLADDEGSLVYQLKGSDFGITNGLNNNTFWALRDRSGTVYLFGAEHLPKKDPVADRLGTLGGSAATGADTNTNSAWGVPVFGNNSGEPCYSSSGLASSHCVQGWQWNLDFVVTPTSDVTVYDYNLPETNYYGMGTAHTLTKYTRGGSLHTISYGWKTADYLASAKPAATVTFGLDAAGRCLTVTGGFTCTNKSITTATAADWPDVPWYLNCASTGACTNYSPSFWTNDRLSTITTQVWDTSLATPGYRTVDTYSLSSNDFPDPADGTVGVNNSASPKAMWLDSITHTGNDTGGGGAAVTEKPVTFTGTFFANRVPGLVEPAVTAMNRQRMTAITTETGAKITIAYASDTCSRTSPPAEDDDTKTCYPVRWAPPGSTNPDGSAKPILDWFNKYLVHQVSVQDTATSRASSPTQTTTYDYRQDGAAWHHSDDDVTAPKYRTWGEFRGYDQVTTWTGGGTDPVTESVSKYLQGMDGDLNLDNTHKSRSVTNDAGDTITDKDPWSGTAYETTTDSQKGGSPQSRSMTVPWLSDPTATHPQGTTANPLPDLDAYHSGTASDYTDTLISGSTWRLTDTVTTNDDTTGLVTSVDDRGEVGRTTHLPVTGGTTPEKCTTTRYAASDATATVPIFGLPDELLTVAGDCSTTADAAHTVSDSKVFYDGSATLGLIPDHESNGTTPASGEPTSSTLLKDWNGTGGTAEWTRPTVLAYDTYGRVISSTDTMGNTTGTKYLPAGTKFLPVQVTTTNPKSWTSTVTQDVARGLPVSSSDVNAKVTSETYDGLGRLSQVWTPDHLKAANPNTPSDKYTYNVSNTGPSWTDSQELLDDGSYSQDYKIYSSLQELVEEQTSPPDGSAGTRLITDTVYDSHGNAVFTDAPYYNDASAPSGTFTTALAATIPQETVTAYDGMGRVTTSTDEYLGAPQWTTTTSYPRGDEVDTVPPTGGTPTAVITDARGQQTELRQFQGTGASGAYDATTYAYDAAGRQTQLTDSSGNSWTTGYDGLGDKVKSTDPDTGTTIAVFNDAKQVVTATDARGSAGTVSTYYDNLGRPTDTWSPDSTSTGAVHLVHNDYDPTGDLGEVKDTVSYDSAGNAWTSAVTGYTDDYLPTGSTQTVPKAALGSASDLTYTTGTTYNPISRTVDFASLPAVGTMPAEAVGYAYNGDGLPVSVGGTNTYLSWMDYTPLGQPQDALAGSVGTEVVQSYTYTPGTTRLQGYTVDAQAGGTGTSQELDNVAYTYNDAGQKTSTTDIQQGGTTPVGTDTQCYQYDYLGRLTQAWTDTAGITTQPAPKVLADGGCTTATPSTTTLGGTAPYWQSYTYDATGNRKSITDHSPLGSAADVTTSSVYNAVATGGAAQTMPHGLATTTGTNGGAQQTFSYDAAGNTTEITSGNGNKILASGATLASGSSLTTNTVRLSMQGDGNLVLYSLKSGQALWSSATEGHPGATATMGTDGNLAVKSTTGTTLWSTGTSSPGAHATLQDNANLVVYDTTGATLWYSHTADDAAGARDIKLTYDHNGRLATTTQGTVTSSYTYDAAGNQIARNDNGTTTLFLGNDQITVNSSGAITGDTRSYATPGAPTAIRVATSGSTTTTLDFQAADPQGTATVDISADNTTVLRRMYTPFGTDRTPGGNPSNWPGTKGYIGGTQDNQTGLTNEGAREYDPALGRFLSRDPILDNTTNPQQWNGYAYSNNDPINASDPSGQRVYDADDNGYCDAACRQTERDSGHAGAREMVAQTSTSPSSDGSSPVVPSGGSSVAFLFAPQYAPVTSTIDAPSAPSISGAAGEPGEAGGGEFGLLALAVDLLLSGDSAQPQVQKLDIDVKKEEQDCLSTVGARTTIQYYDPDDQGRATGATACISPWTGKVDETAAQDPVGWQSNDGMNRSHIVARQFGGTYERINIIPMGNDDNKIAMRNVERKIEGYRAIGQRVFYAGIVVYDKDNGIRPRGIDMWVGTAQSGLTMTIVQNTKWDGTPLTDQ
jgi:RHS repeat-associated protein